MEPPMADTLNNLAVWLSTPHQAMIEIAHDIGYRHVVLDIEHGLFDLEALDRIIALGKALGMTMHAKVLGPEAIPIQQALDMGADSVIIPHIGDVAHALRVTASAKYPTLGTRSFSGTRPARYGGKPDYYDNENAKTRCYPMIESAAALKDVEAILALPTVDGLFVGPSDLSLDSGRGAYRNTDADKADLKKIAEAAAKAGKPWIMPAWSRTERTFAQDLGASLMVVADEYGSIWMGLEDAAKP
jgi:4-hydroxy-2-oxoheptanedioate aldolase